jgi:hypothetical protein
MSLPNSARDHPDNAGEALCSASVGLRADAINLG